MDHRNSYHDIVERIFGLRFRCKKKGLKKMEYLLHRLGDPQEELNVIRVVGTNGKGSVCAMLSSILVEAGYRVGMNTSPHLIDFTERIRIDGARIPRRTMVRMAEEIWPIIYEMEATEGLSCPTFFEVTTALALRYFREERVDLAIMEAGIGGKRDATHMTGGEMVVLTRVAMDHAEELGPTLESVVRDKAGAVREGGVCVTCNPSDILRRIRRELQGRDVRLRAVSPDSVRSTDGGTWGSEFVFRNGICSPEPFRLSLIGRHQMRNAALAIATAEEINRLGYREDLPIGNASVRKGLAGVEWHGRTEILKRTPLLIVDCAHNPNAVSQLADDLRMFEYDRLHLIFGACDKKDIDAMLDKLSPIADTMIFTKANSERAVAPEKLRKASERPSDSAPNSEIALDKALERAGKNDAILVCGSVYLVGEIMGLTGAE